jgi:hypothetical protein
LLDRARGGEFTLHIPNICFGEARRAILAKCQPRAEANAIRRFLSWAHESRYVEPIHVESTRLVLDKYEAAIKRDLKDLEERLRTLASLPFVEVFGLDQEMLDRSTELALAGFDLKPFDQSILAGTLVRAWRLWDAGERQISLSETDSDLQPWDAYGNAKAPLREEFDAAHVWVYGDFTLTWPQRREGFE